LGEQKQKDRNNLVRNFVCDVSDVDHICFCVSYSKRNSRFCFPFLFPGRRLPASSAIDSKDRIMGGGVSAVARRKGSVHRMAESWNPGDYGKK
jgi:hypothetical protein